MKGFEIAGGSVPGTDHTKPGQPVWKNNQDAFDFLIGDNFLVAIVCDGCGSMDHSEVGAKLGARMLLKHLAEYVSHGYDFASDAESILAETATRVVEKIQLITRIAVSAEHKHMRNVYAAQHFLFTVVGIAMNEKTTMVFSFGDGVYSVNGQTNVIPPFPNNEPPYLAYQFIPSSINPALLKFEIHAILPTKEVESLLIGSDGVADLIEAAEKPLPVSGAILGPLSQFWEDAKYTTNPDAIRRRLALANREHIHDGLIKSGFLHDDTTLLVVRRMLEEDKANA